MSLEYAVERLYEVGWSPSSTIDLETLEDGRRFPSVVAIQREFARAGLELSIKHNLIFKCYRAGWSPVGDALDSQLDVEQRTGTVIGACEREAAVYALAQLRIAQQERQLVGA